MNPAFYHLLHIFALLVLTAHTFMAFANPDPASRKQTLIITGIASLLMLVSGFGLLAKLYANHFSAWVIVKLVCWIGLSALAGIAYRRPQLRGKLALIALSLLLIALVMVYFQPAF
ncbi:MAG: SirB2 family protein [Opitutaceae bacterium]|nr:SirB2 family protein [Opitutaceae bacterium]